MRKKGRCHKEWRADDDSIRIASRLAQKKCYPSDFDVHWNKIHIVEILECKQTNFSKLTSYFKRRQKSSNGYPHRAK